MNISKTAIRRLPARRDLGEILTIFFFISNIERVHRKQSNDVKFISKFHVKRKISANEKGRKSSRTI